MFKNGLSGDLARKLIFSVEEKKYLTTGEKIYTKNFRGEESSPKSIP